MLITDSRRIIEMMAKELIVGTEDMVSIDMQDIEKVLQCQNVKSLYIDGAIERAIATLKGFSTEFTDAKIAVVQISAAAEHDLKMRDVNDLLDAIRNGEGCHCDIIWGMNIKSDIPLGEAAIFIVYAAD